MSWFDWQASFYRAIKSSLLQFYFFLSLYDTIPQTGRRVCVQRAEKSKSQEQLTNQPRGNHERRDKRKPFRPDWHGRHVEHLHGFWQLLYDDTDRISCNDVPPAQFWAASFASAALMLQLFHLHGFWQLHNDTDHISCNVAAVPPAWRLTASMRWHWPHQLRCCCCSATRHVCELYRNRALIPDKPRQINGSDWLTQSSWKSVMLQVCSAQEGKNQTNE